jgi:hypothetical protein
MATKETVENYVAAWNETDETKRRDLIAQCWADSGTYTDPVADVSGRDGLHGLISQFQQQMPGASIAITSGVDEHHGRIRFGWRLDGGPQAMEGIDVGQLSTDGRIQSIVGFWGASPPAA